MADYKDLLDGLDMDEIEIEDQGFYLDDYECEVYWDQKEWNGARTDYIAGGLIVEGNTISPLSFTDETGSLDRQSYVSEIRRQIQMGIDHEDRIGPVYVVL